jgi:hypothetical protein
MTSRLASLALPAVLLLGCSSGGDGPGGGGGDPASESGLAGRYEITSHYDLSQADGVPERVSDAIAALTGLSDDPAGTIIALLEAADIAALNHLLDAVPPSLVNAVKGWINDYVARRLYDGSPVAGQIAEWADNIATILTDFEIITTLDLGNSVGGSATANHSLAAVAFQLEGSRRLVDTPDLIDQLSAARDVRCEIAGDADGAELIDIGDHAFHLPLGDFALVAVNQAISAKLGVPDLRGAIGLLIDCGGLAQEISSKCLFNVCVGHKAELEAFCDAGLDQVAARIEDKIAAIDYAELQLAAGQAVLVDGKADAAADGRVDAMEQGAWQAVFDLDGHDLAVEASFTGRRLD